jgi:hypothetical protein
MPAVCEIGSPASALKSLRTYDHSGTPERARPWLERWNRRVAARILRAAIKELRRDRPHQAISCLQRLNRLMPALPSVALLLGEAAWRGTAPSVLVEAIRSASLTVRNTPRSVGRLAWLCYAVGDSDRATSLVESGLQCFPRSSFLLGVQASMQVERGDYRAAIASYCRQRALASGKRARAMATVRLAHSLELTGDTSRAVRLYRGVIARGRCVGEAASRLVDCQQQLDASDAMVPCLESKLCNEQLDPTDAMQIRYALGHLYDRAEQPEQAFPHFKLANATRERHHKWSLSARTREVRARIKSHTPDRVAALAKHGSEDDAGIIVVGMPRSGTTLIEQILSAHPAVHGLGERTDISYLTRTIHTDLGVRARYPHCFDRITPSIIRNLSRELARTRRAAMGPCVRYVTKTPEDYLDLGLIWALLPRARIIHAVRDPVDTCLSCHMQSFANVPYATDLRQLREVYLLYRDIMKHWRSVLPAGSMIEVAYEELVSSPGHVIPRLCEFCSIPFDEACMRFHLSRRYVNTASRWQVRQPLYQSSVRRWQRYRNFIGPILCLEGLDSSNCLVAGGG